MITVKISDTGPVKWQDLEEAGKWLDKSFPNPAMPAPQRWWICGPAFAFKDDKDASMFLLKWAK